MNKCISVDYEGPINDKFFRHLGTYILLVRFSTDLSCVSCFWTDNLRFRASWSLPNLLSLNLLKLKLEKNTIVSTSQTVSTNSVKFVNIIKPIQTKSKSNFYVILLLIIRSSKMDREMSNKMVMVKLLHELSA